jgi:hypothetical protein
MARDLFIDLTNNRLAASETNLAPAAPPVFTKGDNGTFNLYFLQATGIINAPFTVVDRSTTSVKLGIGSRIGLPETGDYTLTFGGDTTSAIPAAATAGQIATALNALSAISSAGGVTVTGALDDHFTIRFATAGTRGSFTADVSQVIPDTVAVIDERLAGSATAKEVAEIQLRLTPAVFQPTWTNLSTTVTATIATTVTGSGVQNEIQRLTFSQKPFAGTFRLTFPDIALTSNSTVTAGTFITTVTHGLVLNQPITITGFDTTITGFTRGATVFVNSIPSVTSFLIATTAGGTTITAASATAATTAGSIATFLRQSNPLPASAVAADIATALQAFDSIGAGGVSVAGIDGEFADITFSGGKGFCDQPEITIQSGLTAKPGKTADVNFSTFALRDLVGSSNAVNLDLEIELTDSGTRQTVILSGCAVSEELIDANAFSPVVGYPSYIFQALTAAATNATTSFVAITALNWTAQANSEYLVEYNLLVSDSANASHQGQITAPTGSNIYGKWITCDRTNSRYSPSSTNLSSSAQFTVMTPGQTASSNQRAYLGTGSTAGTVSFQFAKNVAGITATANEISSGSWVRVEKIS